MVIYSTVGGTTRKVAQRVAARTGDDTVTDAATALASNASGHGHVLLFCPTYGDEEVEDTFERLLLEWDWKAMRGAWFSFCELGIYTGYESPGHGLIPIVYDVMTRHGLRELVAPLSLDSVPITDWDRVDAWADSIRKALGHA